MPVPLTLLQRFEKYVVSENLIKQGMKLVIGVSGGADSIALLYLLYHLRTNMHLSLVAVHINHNLRGGESAADEEFVKKICSNLNIPTVIRSISFDSKADLENQARIKRKEILLHIMKSYKCDKIVLAHQKNDQAETILMNISRGAGITGMGGIKPLSEAFLRPLLTFSRADIETWLKSNNYTWRHDSSNDELTYTRNKIRKELIPWMETNLNQSLVERLALQARIFQQADEWFRKKTLKHLKKLVQDETSEQIVLNLADLKQLAEIEQFYLLRACYSSLSKTDHEFFMHSFEEIHKLFNSQGSKQTRLAHNIWIIKQYDELILSTYNPTMITEDIKELVIDEERTHFVFNNLRFTLKYIKNLPKDYREIQSAHNVFIDLNKVNAPLKLRSRQIGDRFIPTGMTVDKKLKEFFIDEKVPKLDRDKVPLLTDTEKIIWVVGYRMDARAVSSDDTHRILHITVEPVTTGRKRSANRAFNNKEGKYDIYEF